MSEGNFIIGNSFSGDLMEWLKQIPEEKIDEVINILNINPAEFMPQSGYSPIKEEKYDWLLTKKYQLWNDLVKAIHRWGMPSPTKLGITPKDLKEHLSKIQIQIQRTVEMLESLEYEALFSKGTLSKECTTGMGLREVSEVLRCNQEGTAGKFFSAGGIATNIKEGKGRKYYPFDNHLEEALIALKNIERSTKKLSQDSRYIPSTKGKKKKGKDDSDHLFWAICTIFKKYTGEIPTAYVNDYGGAEGKIIRFLSCILPMSHYPFQTTDWALEKKIREMKTDPKFKSLWQDAKS